MEVIKQWTLLEGKAFIIIEFNTAHSTVFLLIENQTRCCRKLRPADKQFLTCITRVLLAPKELGVVLREALTPEFKSQLCDPRKII